MLLKIIMTRLKTKSTHGGIVGKANTKQGTSLGQNIYKVHNKNTLWRLTTTRHTAFRLSPKVFDFVSVHLQVSDDHLSATTVDGLLHLPLGIQIYRTLAMTKPKNHLQY